MFTINIYLKFALIAVFLGGGILLAAIYGLGYSWILIVIGLGFLISYILLGTIQSASMKVQVSDFEGAEKRLGLTLKPEWLYVTNRAFYYILKGSLAANKQQNAEAEDSFNKALSLKLPTDNEKAMVLLQLSNINATKGRWNAAKKYFREAKKLRVTESQLKEQMDQFDKALKNSGQLRSGQAMSRGGRRGGGVIMNPGGKRRRPKMR